MNLQVHFAVGAGPHLTSACQLVSKRFWLTKSFCAKDVFIHSCGKQPQFPLPKLLQLSLPSKVLHLERDAWSMVKRLRQATNEHAPLPRSKKLKLRFRVGDLDLPERRKRYTSSREEEEEDAQKCPCGKTMESRTHIVAECELYKEERDVAEGEVRDMNEDGMKSFDALDSREKAIVILGDGGHRRRNRKGIRYVNGFYVTYGRNVLSTELLEVPLLGEGTVLRLERDAWSTVKRLTQATN